MICGYHDWVEVEDFGKVFKRLNKDELSHPRIAIDGKFIQGSHNSDNPLQMVTTFSSQTKLVLAQTDIANKTNEINTSPQLLKLIDIGGSIITADAMYCQKDITKQTSKAKKDYLFALKYNHKTLYEYVSLWLNSGFDKHKLSIIQTINKNHGRLETRRYAMFTQLDWLQGKDDWTNFNAVVMVEAVREVKDRITTECRHYLTSLTDLIIIANTIRSHWCIENINIGCLMLSLVKISKNLLSVMKNPIRLYLPESL